MLSCEIFFRNFKYKCALTVKVAIQFQCNELLILLIILNCNYNWFSGADGGLDFGTMRVGEESKQVCALKNKGRYEIAYHFVFEKGIDKLPPNLHELFTVTPNRGSLIPSDRPTQVQVMYKSKNEIALKDLPILKCQVGLCVFALATIISSNVCFIYLTFPIFLFPC